MEYLDIRIDYSHSPSVTVAWLHIYNLRVDAAFSIPVENDLIIHDREKKYIPLLKVNGISVHIFKKNEFDKKYEEGFRELKMRISPASDDQIITGHFEEGNWHYSR